MKNPAPAPDPAKTILVVEDDPDIRETVALVLEEAGFVVETAPHGAAALTRLREGSAPSLILLDLMMPVMNARQFLEERARDARLEAIPVLLLTAAGEARSFDLGVRAVLRKPFSLDALLELVQAHCA